MSERVDEGIVQRALAVVRVKREQVVDRTTQCEALLSAVDGFCHCKDASVGTALCEAKVEEPRKERALPASACLCHAVNWFFNSADTGTPVGADRGVPGRRVA
eukprot:3098532-Pleurochrysis_carterae.AAC.1